MRIEFVFTRQSGSLGGSFDADILLDLSSLETGSADGNPFRGSFNYRSDSLKVGRPASLGNIVGVRDVISKKRLLSAYFANF